MKFLDVLVLMLLFVLLGVGSYVLWLNFPTQPTAFEQFVANASIDLPVQSAQFHPNMRYPSRDISFTIAEGCSLKKRNDFLDAVDLLARETILSFHEVNRDGDIEVTCSNVAPEPDEAGHFVAGEGGPSIIINASQFAVITKGKIALFRVETCETPQVATHELLHALGFDHNSNEDSIMFPVTNCGQTIDPFLKEEIARLYSIPTAPDLLIEKVSAVKTGRYLNASIVFVNYGLERVEESTISVFAGDTLIKTYDSGALGIGAKKSLEFSNVRIPRETVAIRVQVATPQREITLANNEAEVGLIQTA